ELLNSLYDANLLLSRSERFFLRLNRNGLPKAPDKPERHCSLFVDLSSGELRRDIYITVHIIRIGRMGAGEKKNACSVQYRRPFGCAVLSIADLLTGETKDDLILKVYMCNTESEWHQIHENIIKKLNARYNLTGSNAGARVDLSASEGNEKQQLQRELRGRKGHGLFPGRFLPVLRIRPPPERRADCRNSRQRGVCEPLGFITEKRRLSNEFLKKSGSAAPHRIEVRSGVPNVQTPPPAHRPRKAVLSYGVSPAVLWSSVLKTEEKENRFLTIGSGTCWRHLSARRIACDLLAHLWGFLIMKLSFSPARSWTQITYMLLVYSCTGLNTSPGYCRACFVRFNGNGVEDLGRARQCLLLSSTLVSLGWTNEIMTHIFPNLRGEANTPCRRILGPLGSMAFLFPPNICFLCFPSSVFSSIHMGSKCVSSLIALSSVKYSAYIKEKKPLMQMPSGSIFSSSTAPSTTKKKVGRADEEAAGAHRPHHITQLQIPQLFSADRLRSSSCPGRPSHHSNVQPLLPPDLPSYQGSSKPRGSHTASKPYFSKRVKTLLCAGIVGWEKELLALNMDRVGLLPVLTRYHHPVPADDEVGGRGCAGTLTAPPADSRCILLPVVLHHLHMHLRQQKDLVACARILSNVFCLSKKNSSEKSVLEEIDVIVASLLDILLRTILEITSRPQASGPATRLHFQDVTGEFVACLLSLLRQMTDRHYQQLLDSFSTKEELRDFLLQIFTVFRILIRPEMFPKDWTVMRLVANNVIITTVLYLSDALRKNFLNENFDYKIWDSYFFLAVIFINQLCLQLEMFTPSKKKKVLEKYGDMRVTMGCEIFSMWQNLGEHKLHFIPALIGPFLEVTLIPQPDLRNVMIPIFHDMMDWEQRRSGNFKQVEAKLIDKLDSLMSEGKGDETYRELFNSIIPLFGPYPSLLKKIERETWRESGVSLIATVTRLMERLLDYRDCMKVGEVDGKKIGCTVSLLNFYKTELNKEEMYIRYIHKLYDLHLKAQNFTEAAYTLLLYDELLEWSDRPLREFLSYPAQTEWQRKEHLHLAIIQNFDRGKTFNNGHV
uniref:DOCKER domain-containing protein n=1 Tax=Myotis lucifugus TaxID=59463 RepID=G1PY53_MYOLU